MGSFLIVSIVIRLAAIAFGMAWSVVLLRRLRDWRIALFTLALGLMAAREGLTLLGRRDYGFLSLLSGAGETPGIVLSLLEAGAIFFLVQIVVEWRRSADALRESERRFRALAETTSSAIAMLQDDKIRYVNPALEVLTGYSQEELLGMTLWDLVPPDSRDAIVRGRLARKTGKPSSGRGEFKIVTKSGEERWVDYGVGVIEFEGQPTIIATGFDITERRRADVELKKREAQLVDAQRLAHIGSWEWDIPADTVSWSDEMYRIWGVKPGGFGATYEDVIQGVHPEDREAFVDSVERAKRDGNPYTIEFRTIRADGTIRIVQSRGAVVVDELGRVTRMFGTGQDITERKQAEQALRESQVHLQAILENCPAMIFLKDTEGRYLQVNRTLEQTFNLSSEQVLGRTDAEVFSPELAAAFRATDERVLRAGRAMESEEDAVYADGPHTYIVHKFPLRNAAGDICAIGGISTDITARKGDETELRAQKEVLQKIFDHIPVLISFIGKDGRFKLVNRAWERTLGWSLEETVNQDLDVLRQQYPDPQDHQNVLDFIARASGRWAEFRTKVRDGRVIDTTWAHIRLSDGTSIGIGQDITEQKRAQEALRESHNFQRAIVEGTPDAVFVKDCQGHYQMINSAGAGFIGKPAEEIIGRNDADVFPPETGREIMLRDQEVMASGKAQTFEETYTAAGMTRTFLTTKDVYQDSKGTVIGLIGIARDITGRKRDEERLQEYEKVVEGLEEMIVVVDREYRYLLANRAFLRYRSMEREQLVGQLMPELLDKETFEKVIKPKVDECLQGKTVNYELRYTYPKLGARDLFISYFPVEGPDGVDRVVAILRDITERKRAEEALRQSEERFSKAFHSSPAALSISVLEDGRLVEVNTAFSQLTGYSQSEVLGKTSLELGLWAIPDHRTTMAQTLRERGALRDLETRFRKKSGEICDVLLSLELIELRGKPCVLGIVQDVTDRKRAEEALRASEERYRDLVENAHDIIYSHDLEGNYISVNKAVEQITGYSGEEALKMNFARIIAPEDLERARSMIRRKLAGETETVYDLEIVAKDGRRIAFEVNTRLIHQDGVPVGIHGIARDVTERKRVQEELRESEERYRDLVENSTELICTHDLDGVILSANRASIKLLGYEGKDYVGKWNIRDLLPLDLRDRFDNYLATLRKDGVASGVMVAQTSTGERRIWEYHNTLRTEGVAKPIVRGMARDITERRRAEEQIKATSAQLRALSASLRSAREEEGTRIGRELHDELGSALTGLKLDLEEVQRSLSGHGSEMTPSALQQKLASMTSLADETIDAVKRISAELRPSILDDLGLVAAIEWQCEQFAARGGIPCQCHSLIENVDLTRDRATAVFRVLQEAFTNILRHAHATRVTITIQEEQGEFVFEVRDDGRGITEAEIMNPRSLGLTGMRERVYLAGGTIEITGAAGIGTVLTVRVPSKS